MFAPEIEKHILPLSEIFFCGCPWQWCQLTKSALMSGSLFSGLSDARWTATVLVCVCTLYGISCNVVVPCERKIICLNFSVSVRSSVTLMGFTKDVRGKRIVCGDNLFAEILRGRQKHDVTIQVRMRTY